MNTSGPGVDTHEMVLIHRVIRREFGQLPRLFRAAANDRARSEVIGPHAREMLHFLHTHHTGEDELLWPHASSPIPTCSSRSLHPARPGRRSRRRRLSAPGARSGKNAWRWH